jgi:subtilisin family serine protease
MMIRRVAVFRRTGLRIGLGLVLAVASGCSRTARAPAEGAIARPLPLQRVEAGTERFEGSFRVQLAAANPSRRFVALVDLTEQLDLKTYARRLRASSASKAATRAAVVGALESVASRQQARLRPLLDRLLAEGAIGYVHPVAVVNRLVIEGTPDGLLSIASSDEVAAVRPDWTSERAASRTGEVQVEADAPLGPSFTSWAIDAMKADKLWRRGIDGAGVIVATIDTGAFEAHEQLRDRRLPGDRGWFDPVEGSAAATDRHGHGTGVLAQAVGGNPNGRVVGVAPGARWAAALGNWKNFYSRSRMTLAADWILRVARPDVLINAWSHEEGNCNDFDRSFIDAWKASGIFVVFPAGNGGPGRATGESPAQLGGIFPRGGGAFSVAGLTETGGPQARSSRGPSRCGSPAFPTLAAPGANLPMASLGDPRAYVRGEGTSLSAGLVGGAAALLLQAAPETDPETLERVLVRSARDVAPAGRDDATGAGAVDLEAALALLLPRSTP